MGLETVKNTMAGETNTKQSFDVAIVVSGFPSLSETFIALQISELVKRGNRIKIYNLGEMGNIAWLPEGSREYLGRLNVVSFKYLHEKLSIYRLVRYFIFRPRLFFNLSKPSGFHTFGRLYSLKQAYFFGMMSRHSIIHFQFATHASIYTNLISHGLQVPNKQRVVCSIRGFDISKEDFVKKINWQQLVTNVDIFLPVCDFLANKLSKKYNEPPTRVVYSPTRNPSQENLNNDVAPVSEPITFVTVGRLVEKKGVHIALQAMRKLKNDGFRFKYIIVGDGQLKSSLEKQIKSYGLQDCVDLIGALPNDQTVQLISHSDIMLVPSTTAADGDVEGIPNVIKEAMLLRVLVVATDHAGIPEIVVDEETGFLAQEGNPDSLAYAITRALGKFDKWHTLIANAYELVTDRFSVESTTNELEYVYRDILMGD